VAGIIHRDISLNNIMYRKKDDKIIGVLIDWDLSVLVDPKPGEEPFGSTSKQRTGTKPYSGVQK